MNFEELEWEARVLYRVAGIDMDEPASMATLARKTLGRPVEVVAFRTFPGDACLATVNGEKRIFIRRKLSRERARFAVAHELAHWALGLDSSSLENEEICDAMAACLVVPAEAFGVALATSARLSDLALAFTVTDGCLALRIGETSGAPLALSSHGRVRFRGAHFDQRGAIQSIRLNRKERAWYPIDRSEFRILGHQ